MKKIHRILVLLILAMGIFMMGTGVLLRFPTLMTSTFTFLDPGLVRYLHNTISTYFSIILLVMLMTGTWMYIYLWLAERKRANTSRQTSQQQ